MQALICDSFGPINQLKIKEVSDPTPLPDQVVIDVAYAAVNFPDALVVQGLYQNKPPFPFSPGNEMSGVITALGSNIKDLKIGQRVFGYSSHGGFAQKLALDSHNVMPLPDSMSLAIGSAITLTYGTSLHALQNIAALKANETLLVLGASGGVGIAAVELAKIMGAKVIACVSTTEKAQFCKQMGADYTINYETEDLKARIKELTGDQGVQVVYDAVGGKHAETALRSLSWRGRFLVVGFASGEIPKIPLNLALLSERFIMGVFWGAWTRRNFQEHLQNMEKIGHWIKDGSLRPVITKTYPFEDSVQAIEHLASRKAMGKVVIEINANL
jgi:NADPH:quinone reductase